MKKLILASASKYRKELLERLGLAFESIASDVDEDVFKQQIKNPQELAATLAHQKAKSILDKHIDAVVIGSDQVAFVDDMILGKTGSLEGSIEQLKLLSGKTHALITAYCVMDQEQSLTKINTTYLKMKSLNESQIKNYLSFDNPFDCAGSYKLEQRGISLFEEIRTEDHTAIIGLPLVQLGVDLEKFGFIIPPIK